MARILYVDDDDMTLDIMGKATEVLGHQPILVRSGKEVLEQISNACPDLIMLDMLMPDMDGLTLLESIRNMNSAAANIPVIILSAGTAKDDGVRAEAAGAQAFLYKPVSLVTLANTIQKFTKNSST